VTVVIDKTNSMEVTGYTINCLVTKILLIIFFCVQQKKLI